MNLFKRKNKRPTCSTQGAVCWFNCQGDRSITRRCSAAGTNRRSSSAHRPVHSKSAGSKTSGSNVACGNGACGSTWCGSTWERSSSGRHSTKVRQHSSGQQQRKSARRHRSARRHKSAHRLRHSKSACSSGACGNGARGSTWGRSSSERRSTRARQRSTSVRHNTKVHNSHGGALARPRRSPTQTGRRRAEPAAQCGISWTVAPKQNGWFSQLGSLGSAFASGA